MKNVIVLSLLNLLGPGVIPIVNASAENDTTFLKFEEAEGLYQVTESERQAQGLGRSPLQKVLDLHAYIERYVGQMSVLQVQFPTFTQNHREALSATGRYDDDQVELLTRQYKDQLTDIVKALYKERMISACIDGKVEDSQKFERAYLVMHLGTELVEMGYPR